MTLNHLPPLREIIRHYGLRAEKGLGQHFLLDLNLTGRIARAAGDLTDCCVIEIGPGPGGLTRALLEHGAKHIIAVEQDGRCVEALANLVAASQGRLTVLHQDALKINEEKIAKKYCNNSAIKIISNLPYNISTVLLTKWLNEITLFESLTLMFQKEVAERIAAAPGSKAYGRLSVLAQFLCEVNYEFNITAKAFTPPPKIDSTVITLTPYKMPRYTADKLLLQQVAKAAFGKRRKVLRTSLKDITPKPELLLEAAEIDSGLRPETLTVEEFCRLAEAWRKAVQNPSPQKPPDPPVIA